MTLTATGKANEKVTMPQTTILVVLLSRSRLLSLLAVVTVAEATLKGNCRDDIYYRLKNDTNDTLKI